MNLCARAQEIRDGWMHASQVSVGEHASVTINRERDLRTMTRRIESHMYRCRLCSK